MKNSSGIATEFFEKANDAIRRGTLIQTAVANALDRGSGDLMESLGRLALRVEERNPTLQIINRLL